MIRSSLAACFLLTLLTGTCLSVSSAARDIYVDNVTGDDRRDGSTAELMGQRGGPFRTITRALRSVQAGDRVILARTDEPYRESITLQAGRHSGTAQQPFELVGNGAMLDGSRPIPANAWEHVRDDLFRYRPARMSFQILYLGERPASRRNVIAEQGLPPLEPLEWCLYDRYLYFRTEVGKLPGSYQLACPDLTVGITLYEVHHVVVRDLVVQGFQVDGVNAHDSVFFGRLQGLVCRGNGRSGISIGGACRIQVADCLVGDNGTAQVRTEGGCKAELIQCQLLENTAPAIVRDGGDVVVSEKPAPP